MMQTKTAVQKVTCDGCGQGTTSEHIARRLERLEQTTRYRPIHIQAVFLSAQSPANPQAFLYGAQNGFQGEAGALLNALQIECGGRAPEAVLSEFQRKGFFLTHVLECAADSEAGSFDLTAALMERLPSVLRRMRTSLKPKRVFVISKEMETVSAELKAAKIGGEIVLDGDLPFDSEDPGSVARLRSAL
jgi:hypothetical protein